MSGDERTNRLIIASELVIASICLLTSAHLESVGKVTPQWVVAIGSVAAGALATMALPLGGRSNGRTNGGGGP